MKLVKIGTLVFFIVLILSLLVLIHIGYALQSLLDGSQSIDVINSQYWQLQKEAGIYGIIGFIVLLLIGFGLYYLTQKTSYILLANIFYLAIILFVFFTTNKDYYVVQNLDYKAQNEFWLTAFMGIFYILGAVLVSAIGYITVRNYTKRVQHTIGKGERKN